MWINWLSKKWIKLDLSILEYYIFSKYAPKCYPSSLTANLFCKYVQHALKYTWYMIYQKKIGASETLLLTYLRGLANTKSCIPNRNSRQFKWSIWKRNFFRKSQTSVLNNKRKNGGRYIDIMTQDDPYGPYMNFDLWVSSRNMPRVNKLKIYSQTRVKLFFVLLERLSFY